MQQVTGHCGKCGAPYMQETGPWFGVLPPPIVPSCQCWNTGKVVTTTSGTIATVHDGHDHD